MMFAFALATHGALAHINAPKPSIPMMSAGVNASLDALIDSTSRYGREAKLCLTKVFSGGHYYIQVSRPSGGAIDYLGAKVDNLLATYTFDSNGRLEDKAIWGQTSATSLKASEKQRIAKVLTYAFGQEDNFPWLRDNVQISVMQFANKYSIYVEPAGVQKASRDML